MNMERVDALKHLLLHTGTGQRSSAKSLKSELVAVAEDSGGGRGGDGDRDVSREQVGTTPLVLQFDVAAVIAKLSAELEGSGADEGARKYVDPHFTHPSSPLSTTLALPYSLHSIPCRGKEASCIFDWFAVEGSGELLTIMERDEFATRLLRHSSQLSAHDATVLALRFSDGDRVSVAGFLEYIGSSRFHFI
jgi:hypothetical protein